MIVVQVVPRAGVDAHRLLRSKIIHEARTWSWKNKRKTRLQHVQEQRGYIEVGGAGGVVVARIVPAEPARDEFFLVEKFIGRLSAWFAKDLAAVNLQFLEDAPRARKKRKR